MLLTYPPRSVLRSVTSDHALMLFLSSHGSQVTKSLLRSRMFDYGRDRRAQFDELSVNELA